MLRLLVMSRSRRSLACLLVLFSCCACLCSCDTTSLPTREKGTNKAGEISVAIRLSKIAAANISRAEVVVTGSEMADIRQDLTVTSATITGTVKGIPAGANRLFTLNGYDASGNLSYTGSATATIIAGQQAEVRITVRSVASAGTPILGMESSVSAQREYVSDPVTFVGSYTTTITGRVSNTGTSDATGVVIKFTALNSSGSVIVEASANVGTVPKADRKLFQASFPKTDNFDWESRYVSRAEYKITYSEGSAITGTVTVQ